MQHETQLTGAGEATTISKDGVKVWRPVGDRKSTHHITAIKIPMAVTPLPDFSTTETISSAAVKASPAPAEGTASWHSSVEKLTTLIPRTWEESTCIGRVIDEISIG